MALKVESVVNGRVHAEEALGDPGKRHIRGLRWMAVFCC
jgi:hypothetical protein